MVAKKKAIVLSLAWVLASAPAFASLASAEETVDWSVERRIGVMVLEIEASLKAPDKKESMETIARYGTDSRYYVMIRGWLVQLLKGAESQYAAAREPGLKQKHGDKVAFLKKAIRRIDLE